MEELLEEVLKGIAERMRSEGKVLHMPLEDIATLFRLHKEGRITLPKDVQEKLKDVQIVMGGKQ